MARWKRGRPYVDIWSIVDTGGRVIARYNSENTGDKVELNGLVAKSLSVGEALISTEIVSKDTLMQDGIDLTGADSMLVLHDNSEREKLPAHGAVKSGIMALSVVTPVLNKAQKPIGAIITIDILNNDDHIPDTIAKKIPGLFTTIAMDGVRISTNIIDDNAQSVRGTRLPENVWATIKTGEASVDEWSTRGGRFMSRFEPLRNNAGHVVGSIDVGIDTDSLWVIQRKNQEVIAGTTLLGLLLSLFVALFTTNRIVRPIKQLAGKLNDFAAGDMSARIDIGSVEGSFDEVTRLSGSFNSMMDTVGERERDRVLYMSEIESNSLRCVSLNEDLRKKNDEVELAYEETQSQTEELHSVNEELKLLNEDLDSKNVELRAANSTIIKEERELKRAKDKLRRIFDSIKDYVLVVDTNLFVIEGNKQFLDDFNVDSFRVSGTSLMTYFGAACCADDFPLKKSLETNRPFSVSYIMPGGKVYDIHTYPFIDEEGGRKAVLYIKDVTEQRMLLEKLVHADKLSSLGELVSGVAHELNNPLTGIMCFSDILLAEYTGEDLHSKVQKIRDASERCKKIIENLLTFARVQQPEKKYADINKVVMDSVELRSYQMKVDNVTVELNLDHALPRTMVDENQLEQVFLNLLNNAHDSILEVAGSGTVRISTLVRGARVVIQFKDSGAGISQEVAGKLFDPFFTTKGVGKGTGLGLSISYGIIKEHGGEIAAATAPEGGAVFTITLPVVEKSAGSGAAGDEGAGLDREVKKFPAGLKALVLDDEPLLLDILEQSLESFGFEVERSNRVVDALDKLAKREFDLIISDIKMPGLDGSDFYKEVSSLYPHMLGRLIFITGDSVNRKTRLFLRNTAKYSLKKPFTVEELKKLVFNVVT